MMTNDTRPPQPPSPASHDVVIRWIHKRRCKRIQRNCIAARVIAYSFLLRHPDAAAPCTPQRTPSSGCVSSTLPRRWRRHHVTGTRSPAAACCTPAACCGATRQALSHCSPASIFAHWQSILWAAATTADGPFIRFCLPTARLVTCQRRSKCPRNHRAWVLSASPRSTCAPLLHPSQPQPRTHTF
jgi:hypothetical protein